MAVKKLFFCRASTESATRENHTDREWHSIYQEHGKNNLAGYDRTIREKDEAYEYSA